MKSKFKVSTIFVYLILIFWALTTIFPLAWAIMNSFKSRINIIDNSFKLPIGDLFTFENYTYIMDKYKIVSAYRNSLFISVTVALVVILFAGMAAYILARYNFIGKQVLMALLFAGMMFPIYATIVPVYKIQIGLGLVNNPNVQSQGMQVFLSLVAVILPQIAGNLSFAIIVLMSYIKGLPVELEEAAYMEGCNIFQIFFKVILPLSKPSFVTVGIFGFLWSYNDLFTQMFFLRTEEKHTITVLLNNIASKEGINYGMMMGSVSLIVVPVIIVYLCLQKYIIKGMVVGAVKG